MFFSLTSYFSRSSGNDYNSNAPELKLELGIYKKSSVHVNGSEDEDISKYQNIYKQLILDEKSLAFQVANVENGKFWMVMLYLFSVNQSTELCVFPSSRVYFGQEDEICDILQFSFIYQVNVSTWWLKHFSRWQFSYWLHWNEH